MSGQAKRPGTGIIVARFQVHKLHPGHLDLVNTVKNQYDKVILFLGVSAVNTTRNNPLNFEARKLMVKAAFPDIDVYPLNDQYNNDVWCQILDERIREYCPIGPVTILGSRDSVCKTYIGKFPTVELPARHTISGEQIRKAVKEEGMLASADFRQGIIASTYERYPTNFPTVDAILLNPDGSKILLGRKKKTPNGKWVTPGGFFDATDKSFEEAIKREVREETGAVGVGEPVYLGSAVIDDPRYRGEVDNIVTTLFLIKDIVGEVKAADDLEGLKWFDVKSLLEKDGDVFVDYHKPLWELFKKYLNKNA